MNLGEIINLTRSLRRSKLTFFETMTYHRAVNVFWALFWLAISECSQVTPSVRFCVLANKWTCTAAFVKIVPNLKHACARLWCSIIYIWLCFAVSLGLDVDSVRTSCPSSSLKLLVDWIDFFRALYHSHQAGHNRRHYWHPRDCLIRFLTLYRRKRLLLLFRNLW